MCVLVIWNPAAGVRRPERVRESLRTALQETGLHVRFHIPEDVAQIKPMLRQAVEEGVRKVVAAGGDGTVSAAASVLAGTEAVLGVLPTGTMNHFAKDLGMPLRLPEAIAVIAAGRTGRVDVGSVNGHVFINNASLGFYPVTVEERERLRKRGYTKWTAMAWALVKAYTSLPVLTATIYQDGRERRIETPFVFVGNNRYNVAGLSIGSRPSLTGGRLHVCLGRSRGRAGLTALTLRALLGALRRADLLEMFDAAGTRINPRSETVRIALDGELRVLQSPLEFAIRPRDLRVFLAEGKASIEGAD